MGVEPERNRSSSEILDRLRRIETRITRFMEWSGFDTQSVMPRWDNGVVNVPSIDISLRHILAVVPANWAAGVTVLHKGSEIATISKGRDL